MTTRSLMPLYAPLSPPAAFAVGCRVSVLSGVFAGLTGQIKRLKPHHALVRLDALSVRVRLTALRRCL